MIELGTMAASWAVAGTAKARKQTAHNPRAIQSKRREIFGYVVIIPPTCIGFVNYGVLPVAGVLDPSDVNASHMCHATTWGLFRERGLSTSRVTNNCFGQSGTARREITLSLGISHGNRVLTGSVATRISPQSQSFCRFLREWSATLTQSGYLRIARHPPDNGWWASKVRDQQEWLNAERQELCAHVRPCPLNRLWPNDLLSAGDDPMSRSRLHAFSSRRRGAEPTVRGHACLLTSACQVLARVFGLVLRLASYRDAHRVSLPL